MVSVFALVAAAGSLALALRADRRASRAEAYGRRAYVLVEPHGSGRDGAGLLFDLRVRNVGGTVARDVAVWLEDESGKIVSGPAGGEIAALAPGDEPTRVVLTVSDGALPPPPVSFGIRMSWTDLAGRHERVAAGASVST
jgi:hypothetical protein